MIKNLNLNERAVEMRLTKVKRNLECTIEPDKLREFSKELSMAVKKIEGLTDDKKAYNKRVGSDIAANESKRRELADKVLTGKEQRSVDCKVVYHFDRKEKEIIRNDTNEIVETDIITEEELQEEIRLKDKKKAGTKNTCDFRNKEMSDDQCYRCFKKNEHDPKINSKAECKEKHFKKGKKDEVKKDGKKEEKKPEEKTENKN